MNDFQEAFEGPIIEHIGNEDVKFPVLVIDDYLGWTADLYEKRRIDGERNIPANASLPDRQYIQRMAARDVPSIEDIGQLVWTVPGAKKVLEISLKKDGKEEKEIARIINRIRPARLVMLAMEVSQLFERRVPQNGQAQQTNPPLPGPASAAPGEHETGHSTATPSGTTSAATPAT